MRIVAPKHWPRIHTARLGVDTIALRSRAPRAASPFPCRSSASAASSAVKGQRVLLEAAGLLAARGHNLHITFIGDGPDAAELAACVSALGLDDSVYFLGSLNHAPDLHPPLRSRRLRAAQLRRRHSRRAHGGHGHAARLRQHLELRHPRAHHPRCRMACSSSPARSKQLADALESLLTSPQLRSRLGIAARQRVINAYEQRANLEHTAVLFRKHIVRAVAAG